jgi:hypothetical protein
MLASLLASEAVAKMHKRRELSFAYAAQFWGITENDNANAMDVRLALVRDTLRDAEREVRVGDIKLDDGMIVDANQIAGLIELNEYLLKAFSRHIELLRTR